MQAKRKTERKAKRLAYTQLAERASGVAPWLPLATIFVLALLIVPPLWLALAHWTGVPLASGTNASDYLAVIGGIMGAIFTVGGLVIGLVSVLTQLSIESRIRKGFARLLPELDERARKQIEAYIAFRRAADEQDWQRAEVLANEALEKWPSLQGVRSLMGEQISKVAMEWFVRHEIEGERLVAAPYRPGDTSTAVAIESITGLEFTPNPSPVLFMSREQVPFYQALDWLNAAISHDEDTDATLRARVTLVHGIAGRFREMKQSLQETLQHDSRLRDYFLEPWNMAMLVYACRNATSLDAGLKDIGSTLNYHLPSPTSELLKSLREADMLSHSAGWNVYWIAVERPGIDWSVTGRTPSLVTLHILLGGTRDERTGGVRWRQVGEPENGTIPTDGEQKVGIIELSEQLDSKFFLICQYQPGWGTWRIYH